MIDGTTIMTVKELFFNRVIMRIVKCRD